MMKSWLFVGLLIIHSMLATNVDSEEAAVLTGEAARELYDSLREKTANIQSCRCELESLFCQVDDNQVVPSASYGDCSRFEHLNLWQKDNQARWQTTGSPARINHPAVTYVADPATGTVFVHWRQHQSTEGDAGGGVIEYYMPESKLGTHWSLDRTKLLEVFEGQALDGKPVTVIRQHAEQGSGPFWGWVIWIENATGLAIRADGVTLSKLPHVRFIHVAECRNVSLENIEDEMFSIPTANIVWPQSPSEP